MCADCEGVAAAHVSIVVDTAGVIAAGEGALISVEENCDEKKTAFIGKWAGSDLLWLPVIVTVGAGAGIELNDPVPMRKRWKLAKYRKYTAKSTEKPQIVLNKIPISL